MRILARPSGVCTDHQWVPLLQRHRPSRKAHGDMQAPSVSSTGRGPRRRRAERVSTASPKAAKAAKAAAKPPKQAEGEATKPTRKRRRRETKEELAILYAQFYDRIPASANAEQMATEFADKELRVIMSTNGVLINDFNEATGRYTEKTKIQKINCILSMQRRGCLKPPQQPPGRSPRALASAPSLGRTTAVARRKAPRAGEDGSKDEELETPHLHTDIAEGETEESGDDRPASDDGTSEAEADVLALLSSLSNRRTAEPPQAGSTEDVSVSSLLLLPG